jgi:hypothetical protein
MTGKIPAPPLVVEKHPKEYDGVPWATLIQYSGKPYLVVVAVLESDYLWAYSIEGMTENECEVFYEVMESYWAASLYGEPLHHRVSPDRWIVERKVGNLFGHLLTAYSVDNISRVIGPVRYAEEDPPKSQVRRRKRIDVSKLEVIKK